MCKSNGEFSDFPNYPTWCVYVWIKTCAPEVFRGLVENALRDANGSLSGSGNGHARTQLAEDLARCLEEENPLGAMAGVYGDLLRGAIGDVDFGSISGLLLAECEAAEQRADGLCSGRRKAFRGSRRLVRRYGLVLRHWLKRPPRLHPAPTDSVPGDPAAKTSLGLSAVHPAEDVS